MSIPIALESFGCDRGAINSSSLASREGDFLPSNRRTVCRFGFKAMPTDWKPAPIGPESIQVTSKPFDFLIDPTKERLQLIGFHRYTLSVKRGPTPMWARKAYNARIGVEFRKGINPFASVLKFTEWILTGFCENLQLIRFGLCSESFGLTCNTWPDRNFSVKFTSFEFLPLRNF